MAAALASALQLVSTAIVYFTSARLHGVTDLELAVVGLSFSTALLFASVAELGINTFVIREEASKAGYLRENFKNLIGIYVVSFSTLYLAYNAYCNYIYSDPDLIHLSLSSGSIIFLAAFSRNIISFFIAVEDYVGEMSSYLIEVVVVLATIATAILSHTMLMKFLIDMNLARLISITLVFSIVLYRLRININSQVSISKFLDIISKSWRLGLGNLAAIYIISIDSIVLAFMIDQKDIIEIDDYQSALRITLLFSFIATFSQKIFYPRMASMKFYDQEYFLHQTQNVTKFHTVFTIALVCLLTLNSNYILSFFIGKSGEHANLYFEIMVLALLFRLNYVLNIIIILYHFDSMRLQIAIVCCFTTTALSFFFISVFGVFGVVISFLISSLLNTSIYYFMLYYKIRRNFLVWPWLFLMLSAACIKFIISSATTSTKYLIATLCLVFMGWCLGNIVKIYFKNDQ